ncbi:hypothetical protein KIPB_009301 [Kipferlia bialata]|uniref:Myb-like domain-containing protein n=1 Tax=Kipferlia bialata TaxID=797122 RepID=A0A9K3D1J6_9EUKA|nr:hypothetical protein KIPB_009301 [Kipferlia bialata]|eukprot:g9301.t1
MAQVRLRGMAIDAQTPEAGEEGDSPAPASLGPQELRPLDWTWISSRCQMPEEICRGLFRAVSHHMCMHTHSTGPDPLAASMLQSLRPGPEGRGAPDMRSMPYPDTKGVSLSTHELGVHASVVMGSQASGRTKSTRPPQPRVRQVPVSKGAPLSGPTVIMADTTSSLNAMHTHMPGYPLNPLSGAPSHMGQGMQNNTSYQSGGVGTLPVQRLSAPDSLSRGMTGGTGMGMGAYSSMATSSVSAPTSTSGVSGITTTNPHPSMSSVTSTLGPGTVPASPMPIHSSVPTPMMSPHPDQMAGSAPPSRPVSPARPLPQPQPVPSHPMPQMGPVAAPAPAQTRPLKSKRGGSRRKWGCSEDVFLLLVCRRFGTGLWEEIGRDFFAGYGRTHNHYRNRYAYLRKKATHPEEDSTHIVDAMQNRLRELLDEDAQLGDPGEQPPEPNKKIAKHRSDIDGLFQWSWRVGTDRMLESAKAAANRELQEALKGESPLPRKMKGMKPKKPIPDSDPSQALPDHSIAMGPPSTPLDMGVHSLHPSPSHSSFPLHSDPLSITDPLPHHIPSQGMEGMGVSVSGVSGDLGARGPMGQMGMGSHSHPHSLGGMGMQDPHPLGGMGGMDPGLSGHPMSHPLSIDPHPMPSMGLDPLSDMSVPISSSLPVSQAPSPAPSQPVTPHYTSQPLSNFSSPVAPAQKREPQPT